MEVTKEVTSEVKKEVKRSLFDQEVNQSTGVDADVQWFGEVDLNPRTGKLSADYPAWFMDKQIEDLEEEIRTTQHSIDMELYHGKAKVRIMEELRMKKQRLDAIISSRPKLRDLDKDRIAKSRKTLGDRIGESMYCQTEMMKMTADVTEEAIRMVRPCIKLESAYDHQIAKARRMEVVDGKVSRNNAIDIWRIQGKAIGEDIRTETLRNQR